jgi:hypothetical protein
MNIHRKQAMGEDHRSQPAMASEFFREISSFNTAIAGGWVQSFAQEPESIAHHP